MIIAAPDPAGAVTVTGDFGLYAGPPILCANNNGSGIQIQGSSGPLNRFSMVSRVYSLNLNTGYCNTGHNILPGLMATVPRLQVWFGDWVICVSGTHQTNETSWWQEESSLPYFEGCGTNSNYRFWAGARITRPDGNRYSDLYGGL